MNYNIELYSENTIIDLRNHMDNLRGMILMDENDELFIFKDYYISSFSHIKGLFKKKEVNEFYIKWVKIISNGEEIVRDDSMICSLNGIMTLMNYHDRWIKHQSKLVRFSLTTGTPLNFSSKYE